MKITTFNKIVANNYWDNLSIMKYISRFSQGLSFKLKKLKQPSDLINKSNQVEIEKGVKVKKISSL